MLWESIAKPCFILAREGDGFLSELYLYKSRQGHGEILKFPYKYLIQKNWTLSARVCPSLCFRKIFQCFWDAMMKLYKSSKQDNLLDKMEFFYLDIYCQCNQNKLSLVAGLLYKILGYPR
jgi:hypothetical protein